MTKGPPIAAGAFLSAVAAGTGLAPVTVFKLIRSASHRYKSFPIPKSDGSARIIHQPAREIKLLQRWCVRKIISRFPEHPAALAYKPKTGIKAAAELHGRSRFLLHLDFKNFFPSIKEEDVLALCLENSSRLLPYIQNLDDRKAFCRLVCRNGCLTIGAPSSPALSNAVMHGFDTEVWSVCRHHTIEYSRYADDLYFSSNVPGALKVVAGLVADTLRGVRCPRLELNRDKTSWSSKKRRRRVLGLVLSTEDKVSIGRERKRQIRVRVYLATLGRLKPDEIESLNGMIAFARSIEPDFIKSLQGRYGDDAERSGCGLRFAPKVKRRGLRRQHKSRATHAGN